MIIILPEHRVRQHGAPSLVCRGTFMERLPGPHVGTHRVPGRPQRSSRHGALAPKAQPISVHAEGQFIFAAGYEAMRTKWEQIYQGNVKKSLHGNRSRSVALLGEELLFQAPLCSPSALLRKCSPARLSTCRLHAEQRCQGCLLARSEAFSSLAPWQAPGWVCTTSCLLKYQLPELKDLSPILRGQFPQWPWTTSQGNQV